MNALSFLLLDSPTGLCYAEERNMRHDLIRRCKLGSILLATLMSSCISAAGSPRLQFDFGTGPAASGWVKVSPDDVYSQDRGFGFELGASVNSARRDVEDLLSSDFITGGAPFYFSVCVPQGNYRVLLVLGDPDGISSTTVKAEIRRLMLHEVQTAHGEIKRQCIIVNTRTPKITQERSVRLKDRERTNEMKAWDDKLTLEFNGDCPCVCGVQIERINPPVVYLLGDSTVCDQPLEPWNSWGQMLPRFFKPEVAVANYAQSGESIRSSLSSGRVEKVVSLLKPGDYMFVQFGHNDMKSKDPNALSKYAADLTALIGRSRAKGAIPVLITSMERKHGIEKDTLAGYPDAVRKVAAQTDTTLIDLHRMSKLLYKGMGADIDKAFQDGTHHTVYGSYELAKCVIQGIRKAKLDLANSIKADFGDFDPSHPDTAEAVRIAPSPETSAVKPLGD